MTAANPLIIRIWTCGKCGKQVVENEGSGPYSDPVNFPPEGWDHLRDGNTFACPECMKAELKE